MRTTQIDDAPPPALRTNAIDPVPTTKPGTESSVEPSTSCWELETVGVHDIDVAAITLATAQCDLGPIRRPGRERVVDNVGRERRADLHAFLRIDDVDLVVALPGAGLDVAVEQDPRSLRRRRAHAGRRLGGGGRWLGDSRRRAATGRGRPAGRPSAGRSRQPQPALTTDLPFDRTCVRRRSRRSATRHRRAPGWTC